MTDEYFAQNRLNWDDRAEIHLKDAAGGYRIAAFLAGADNLHDIEHEEIGDVAGLSIAHLQCHIGIDTLCLARRGARCVGLDFSPKSVAAARLLAAQTGLDARFVEGNVYDARSLIDGMFDMVYVTWGAIGWLPDIRRWAGVVASLLKPGGRLYLLEGHPSFMQLDEKAEQLRIGFDWRYPPDRPLTTQEETTYTGDTTRIAHPVTHEWIHPLSEVVNSVIDAGLAITRLNEHERLAWQFAPWMVPVEGRRRMWMLPEGFPKMPVAYSLQARKP
ncbi:class I SAM-dependent methyltransferase [Aestuariivirga litoralis]|uniref:Class I SAM-dependent methyltransferase n=1 Tax=Aestuariivirga litoralis TaxID=2650924 RepID=A0A2W2BMV3_9HYPH|nr:class I SAM-dependent methyltransferase [Aestuariivirga litoralis]PZF77187.1 class I SAM-dependent methyltransferase [Aestuariivirga litoralis]